MPPTIVRTAEQACSSDWLNKNYGLSIEFSWEAWDSIFRIPPEGQVRLPALVRVGDSVMTSDGVGPIKILQIIGPKYDSGPGLVIDCEPRPEHWTLIGTAPNFHPDLKNWTMLHELVAFNGQIMGMYKRDKRKVFVISKGPLSMMLDRYKKAPVLTSLPPKLTRQEAKIVSILSRYKK